MASFSRGEVKREEGKGKKERQKGEKEKKGTEDRSMVGNKGKCEANGRYCKDFGMLFKLDMGRLSIEQYTPLDIRK